LENQRHHSSYSTAVPSFLPTKLQPLCEILQRSKPKSKC
jgi:hypothetical protein